MLIDYIFMTKENNHHHDLTSRFNLSEFFQSWRLSVLYKLIVDLIRGFTIGIGDYYDASEFHHLLLQFFGNSNHSEAFVSVHNRGEFLFAFVL